MATNLTEQYTEMVQQSQDAVRAAVDNWTKTVQQAMGQLPATTTPFAAPYDVNTVVDQVFDLAEKVLEAQRDFAKNLISTSTAAGEAFAKGATEAAEAATEATKSAAKAATKKS
jgi:acetyl-CoA carboxylase carboxyltransferase component